MKESKMEEPKWICTDPDTDQWGREWAPIVFEFKTGDSDPVIIDLRAFSEEKTYSIMSSYYSGSLEDINKELGDSYEWIAAECIYESEFEGKS